MGEWDFIIILTPMKKVVVIWWTSWFGKWLVEYLFDNFRWKIHLYVTWRDDLKWKELEEKYWVIFSKDNIKSVEDADWVFVSVPIFLTVETIEQIWPYLKTGCVLIDVTSIKNSPAQSMNKLIDRGVIAIPAHPVFGPFIKNISWQVIVLTALEEIKSKDEYKILKEFLEWRWVKIIETSPLEHDKMMSVVQGLTHYTLFVLWETLRRLNFDIAFSQKFVSPVYKLMTSTVARYMNQNPWLYADIQMTNSENLNVHEVFIQVAKDFNEFVKSNDKESFVNTVEKTSLHFGQEAAKWQKYTDKLIYLMAKQNDKFRKLLWTQVIIENIYTKEIKEWVLNFCDEEFIGIDEFSYKIDERIIL